MKKRRGFSLIEVLVAGAIVTAALLPITGLSCGQRKMAAVNDDQLKTIALAKSVMDELAPLGFDTLLARSTEGSAGQIIWPMAFDDDRFRVDVQFVVLNEKGLGELVVSVSDLEGKERKRRAKLVSRSNVSMGQLFRLDAGYGLES